MGGVTSRPRRPPWPGPTRSTPITSTLTPLATRWPNSPSRRADADVSDDATCPRCGGVARPPGEWSDRWTCHTHGEIYPVSPVVAPHAGQVHHLIATSTVPWWVPWPLPREWV